jgi:hypothetical protein
MKNTSGPSAILRTTCESQTLSNKVVGELLIISISFKALLLELSYKNGVFFAKMQSK